MDEATKLASSRKRRALSHPEDAAGDYMLPHDDADLIFAACGSGDSFGNFLASVLGVTAEDGRAYAGFAGVLAPQLPRLAVPSPARAASSSTDSEEAFAAAPLLRSPRIPRNVLRCVDGSHAWDCDRRVRTGAVLRCERGGSDAEGAPRSHWCRCTAPPPIEDEGVFMLQGEPGKKNGEKVLNSPRFVFLFGHKVHSVTGGTSLHRFIPCELTLHLPAFAAPAPPRDKDP